MRFHRRAKRCGRPPFWSTPSPRSSASRRSSFTSIWESPWCPADCAPFSAATSVPRGRGIITSCGQIPCVNVSTDRTRQQLSRRIDRARALAREREATSELLTFYADVCEFQQALLRAVPQVLCSTRAAGFSEALNPGSAATLIPGLLEWLKGRPEQGLAAVSRTVVDMQPDQWEQTIARYWGRGGMWVAGEDEIEQFVVETLLQPFAEC